MGGGGGGSVGHRCRCRRMDARTASSTGLSYDPPFLFFLLFCLFDPAQKAGYAVSIGETRSFTGSRPRCLHVAVEEREKVP